MKTFDMKNYTIFEKDFDFENYVMFETVSGSRLYGTNTRESDWDFRGVFMLPTHLMFNPLETLEQIEIEHPDRVLWSFPKFFKMLANGNPNILELLFAPREKWTVSSFEWEMLLEKRELFVTKKAVRAFMGYSAAQAKEVAKTGDGKALLHYNRLVQQAVELCQTGKITFPCEQANWLVGFRSLEMGEVRTHYSISQNYVDATNYRFRTFLDKTNFPEEPDNQKLTQIYKTILESGFGQW